MVIQLEMEVQLCIGKPHSFKNIFFANIFHVIVQKALFRHDKVQYNIAKFLSCFTGTNLTKSKSGAFSDMGKSNNQHLLISTKDFSVRVVSLIAAAEIDSSVNTKLPGSRAAWWLKT
jgi:hypothetical protein